MAKLSNSRGVTLVELMIAVAILAVGILGFFGAFRYVSVSLHVSRTHILATNLGQEKIETLKNLSYYSLLVTTATNSDNNFTPPITYDTGNYPPETIQIGNVAFTRYTFVALAQMTSDVISTTSANFPDTGMKEIIVNVIWNDGGAWKKFTLTNLLENPNINPLDSGIYGYVKDVNNKAIGAAFVRVEQNTDWSSQTDVNGYYNFRVYHGSYTVRASSAGYYDGISSIINVSAGSTVESSTITLTAIASGTVKGIAWISSNVVISQVVASTVQADSSYDVQYFELFNPTTYPIFIGNVSSHSVQVNFTTKAGFSCSDVPLTYSTASVPSNSYYLVANTKTFVVNGSRIAADAYYANVLADGSIPLTGGNCSGSGGGSCSGGGSFRMPCAGHSGTIYLTNPGGGTIDAAGWTNGGTTPNNCNGTCIQLPSGGLPTGDQLVRISSPLPNLSVGDMNAYGHAYNSQINDNDFAPLQTTIQFPPRNTTSGTFVPITGQPAVGANVTASDSLSGSTQAYAAYITSGTRTLLYAPFALVGVTTTPALASCGGNCWNVVVSSHAYYQQISTVTIAQNADTLIPNSNTSPGPPAAGLPSVLLTSSTVNGFLRGGITDINANNVSGIQVQAAGVTKTTGSNGRYYMMVTSGPVTIVVNPNNANQQYVQLVNNVTVPQGDILDANFTLSQGGSIQGYLTSGTSPLPNYVVSASIGGFQSGSATSDTSGNFVIHNLSTGAYTVAPVLDSGQDSSPLSISATVSSTGTVWIGTFTVNGALGTISGAVTYNGATLNTGALVLAQAASLPSTPAAVVASSAPALTNTLYAISAKADGTYSLPVRGNTTYYMAVYVPTISGATVSITTKTYSGLYVTPNNTLTQNVTVP